MNWEAAQHADTTALQQKLLSDILYLYRLAMLATHKDRIRENVRNTALDVAAANGLSKEFKELIDEQH